MFGGALMMVLGAIVAGNGYGWGTWKTGVSLGAHRSGVILGSLGSADRVRPRDPRGLARASTSDCRS